MLTNFLEVGQTGLLAFENGAHPTQSGALETFAAIERIAVFDHANHIAGDGIDEGFGRVDLTECEFVVIAIVEGVAKVGIEGVNVREAGKVGEHGGEAVGYGLLGEFDFAHALIFIFEGCT